MASVFKCSIVFLFFFFKQKTAYEISSRDWSSDVCSSDLVGNYLWDFGGVPELLPLYDPAATKAHIKQFLQIDITKHFLFNPMDGKAGGPWYPVTQEKIILLIYHYVQETGDLGLL